MTLPANWSTVTVTGTYLNIDGEPLKGTVAFSTTTRVVDAGANVTVPPSVRRVSLDNDGKFSVVLPATDDPDAAPTGFTYRVDEDLFLPTGARSLTNYLIQLPAAATTVDLADVAPVTDVAEVTPYLRRVDIGTTAGTVAAGDDPRLSDSRTPTAHAATHQPGGTDAMTVDAAAGVGSLRTLGTGATQAAAGADAVRRQLVDAKGDLIVGTAADTVARLPVGADGLVPHADPAAGAGIVWRTKDPNAYTSGAATFDRIMANNQGISVGTGTLRLTFFTAPRTETWTTIAAVSGTAAAGATPTLCRMAIYSVDASGNLTLVASCANDTTLFAATATRYSRSLTASYDAIAGQRYAFGLLVVSAFTVPTFRGTAVEAATSGTAPRIAGSLSGQSDLPASVTSGSVANSGVVLFGEVL